MGVGATFEEPVLEHGRSSPRGQGGEQRTKDRKCWGQEKYDGGDGFCTAPH